MGRPDLDSWCRGRAIAGPNYSVDSNDSASQRKPQAQYRDSPSSVDLHQGRPVVSPSRAPATPDVRLYHRAVVVAQNEPAGEYSQEADQPSPRHVPRMKCLRHNFEELKMLCPCPCPAFLDLFSVANFPARLSLSEARFQRNLLTRRISVFAVTLCKCST